MALTYRPTLIGTAAEITATDGTNYGEGALAYATDTNQAYRYSGSAWATETDADTVAADLVTANTAITDLATYKPRFSTLTADSADVNASVVLIASGLSVTVPIAGTYLLEAAVLVTTAAAADVSLKFGGTATVTATVGVSDLFYLVGPQAGSNGTVATDPKLLPTSWTTEVETMFANTGASADQPFLFKGKLVVTVVGTIILEFTQGTSDASNTHIDKGSYLMIQRVA